MKKISLTFLVCFFVQISISQNFKIINNEAIHFNLKQKNDIIDFIVIDTKLDVKKPIFLFCQGSLPLPLFVQPENEKMWMIGGGITNFDYLKIIEKYHLIVISMPYTPVVVGEKNVNESYCYVPDTTKPEQFVNEYVKADFLENYEKRAKAVLNFLQKQTWVDNSKLVVAGHSQGSKVATLITLNNRKVTHLGLFSSNPFGRIDQLIRNYRKSAEKKEITWKEADEKIEEKYQMFRDCYDKSRSISDPNLLAWKSFSRPIINDWLRIKVPTYLTYGTNDIASDLCDLVPLFYIQKGKTNLTFKRYLNLDHNFYEVKDGGEVDYDKGHWEDVMNEFLQWTLK
jgi:pimeloyl-ACP methyl ester carboxylesterase